ncbi:type VII secretion protein EccCa [Micromonospora sp. NBC_01813]|uniref:type VII secretion protein EccCa n=1 Tax=Micromonospora sp. NBC_01813 TaxID=2975988 RepID=UPI002DDAB567|nr:type VII secretion protein EccCa [Micromonospora sp. NBC_01813]WSA07158.1 type VII secretion protein EccCa [Micromonospora sp. NBC_01813]
MTPDTVPTIRLLHRAARTVLPLLPQGRLTVAAPPTNLPSNGGVTMITLLLPLLSTIAMAGYMITLGHRWMVVAGIAFIAVSIVSTFGMRYQMSSSARRQRARQRIRYHGHLRGIRRDAREVAAVQRAAVVVAHPSPQRLLAIANHRRRLWERRPTDPDFLRIRIGLGSGPLCVPVALSSRADPMADTDQDLSGAAEAVLREVGTVGRQPGLIDVGRAGVVTVIGPSEAARGVGRAVLCQVAALHAPEDVAIVICAPDAGQHWEWAKWLPHVRTGGPTGDGADGPGAIAPAAVSEDLYALIDVLSPWLARLSAADEPLLLSRTEPDPGRRLLLVIDGYDPASDWVREPVLTGLLARAGKTSGVGVVCLVNHPSRQPPRADVRVNVDDTGRFALDGRPELVAPVDGAVSDAPTPVLAECLARAMAPLRLRPPRAGELVESISVPELLGLSGDEVVGTDRWLPPGSDELLRAPIGIDSEGRPLLLDLKESAQGGVGPHGLVIGATGSGKSELLRTLLVGLAMTHPPDLLSFVLVDFKGGATFANAVDLPHVAGLITNLADDMALVDRVRAALVGEQQRRQRLLRDAGNVDSVREYQVRRAAGGTDVAGAPLPALPYLLVIVDEFGELLTGRPDFIELFVQIGRVGRSLGIHLLLASQRLDEGRLRGLESHLSYRIGLRTFSAAESRAVLGTADAYLLPPLPGSAYLKVDESAYRRFRVSHVSGPAWPPARPAGPVRVTPAPFALLTTGAAVGDPPAVDPAGVDPPAGGPSTMDLVTAALSRVDAVAHQVWLPPLPPAIALGTVLGPVGESPERGLQAEGWPWPGGLRVPLGVLDQPATQQQSAMSADFTTAGNLAVVGAPQTGKSTLLRTTLLALMLTHTPDEAQFACVDLGGGGLRALAAAPHIAGVAGRRDVELARRVLLDTRRLVDERERIFAELGIDSAVRWRQLRARGGLPADVRAADVFLVLDNWPAIRAEFDLADEIVVDVAARGLGVGVHVLLTANRWFDVRSNLRDSFAGRLELRLNDPAESEISRPAARALGDVVAGRGLAPPGVPYQALLPRVDGADTADGLAEALDEVIGKLAAGWSGPAAPEVRVLPRRLPAAQLPVDPDVPGVPVGQDEVGLAPVYLDLTSDDPHLVVLGDSGAGKTQFLRTWMAAMARRYTAWQIRFVVVDYRRTLLGAVSDDYLGAYAADPTAAREYLQQVDSKLAERMPPPGMSGADLARRDWWQGPQLFVVVDDHDLVGGQNSPLAPFVERLPHGHDLGFHVVVARRVSGSSRGFAVDQLLARLREQQPAALILPGDSREGVLFGGHRAQAGPPGRGRLLRRSHPDTVIQVAVEEA